MDISVRRIVITEDEDLDLDHLLLGDTSGVQLVASSPPSSPPANNDATKVLEAAAQCVSNDSAAAAPARSILALEEEEEDGDEGEGGHWGSAGGNWVLPPVAQPGDYINTINNSMRRVPSKSILKKTSSYGNFAGFDSSQSSSKKSSYLSFNNIDSSSQSQSSASGRRSRQVSNSSNSLPLDSSLSGSVSKMTKKKSFLGLGSMNWNDGYNSQESSEQQVAIGWDLDDSTPSVQLPSPNSPPPAMPNLAVPDAADTSGADRAAGMDSSGSRHSGASISKIRRNVSFHSVDVREYDRTVGDNPSCRSGPPLSLDWSYSKNYEKNLDEYELERSTDRVKHLKQLHVNKYKRRNLLAHNWGHTEGEMKEARQSTKKLQRQRSMTQMLLPVHMAEEALISFKNFVGKKKKKNKDGKREDDDCSELSNSASTKDSSHRYTGSPSSRLAHHEDSVHVRFSGKGNFSSSSNRTA